MSSPLESIRRLSSASAALLLTRAESASLELAQARAQLVRWLLFAFGVGLLALAGLLAASAALVVVLWARFEWATLVLLALVYGGIAVALFRRLQHEIGTAPPLLAQTLEELARDREALLATGRGHESAPPP